MEAHLLRKSLHPRRPPYLSVSTACSTKTLSLKCASAECRGLPPSAVFSSYLFLIRTFPGALNSFCLPMTSLFFFLLLLLLRTLHGTYSFAKLDSLENTSAAAFCIIGLAKIPRIEFLLLDWIYCSIRIMTVFKKKTMNTIDSLLSNTIFTFSRWSQMGSSY